MYRYHMFDFDSVLDHIIILTKAQGDYHWLNKYY